MVTSLRLALAVGLLRVSSLLVPASERSRWLEGWQAELW